MISSDILLEELLKKTNEDFDDLSDLQEQQKCLKIMMKDFEPHKQPSVHIRYDQATGTTQTFLKQQTLDLITQTAKIDDHSQQTVVKNLNQSEEGSTLLNRFKGLFEVCGSLNHETQHQLFKPQRILYNTLKLQEYTWLEENYQRLGQNQLSQLPVDILQKVRQILKSKQKDLVERGLKTQGRKSVCRSLSFLSLVYDKMIERKEKNYFGWLFEIKHRKDSIFTLLVSMYDGFKVNYCPLKRTVLKEAFQQLQEKQVFENSIEVLRFLESHDQIMKTVKPITQQEINSQVTQILEKPKELIGVQYPKQIDLVKVSESVKRRRVVNILVSGFLSEDMDKKNQWKQLLACMPDSEVYGLEWKSDTIKKLLKFLAISVKDLIMGKNLSDLLTKDNPFIPAFESAKKAGEELAYVVHKLFPFQLINVVSYSLGSQLARAFVEKMEELNSEKKINKIILLGGVSDTQLFSKTLAKSQNTINVLNLRSDKDSVLRRILKLAKPAIQPIGLFPLPESASTEQHLIQDVDVTEEISGHFSYMMNFGTIAEKLDLNQQ